MPEIILQDDLIEIGLQAAAKEQVLKTLSDRFLAHDYVTDDFYDNLIRREQEFPTGLPTAIPIAICHTEAQYVKQSALAVATLSSPVPFSEMGTPERSVDAEIVFLLALKDPKEQVPWLKKMVSVFRSRENLQRIRSSEDSASLLHSLEALLRG